MSESTPLGPDPRHLYTYQELPIGSTAVGLPPEKRQTGLWRYTRPRLETRLPPCQEACPLGNWIQRFVSLAGAGEIKEAVSALWLENPFPGLCGRVCYHPCQDSCNRAELEGATSIRAIERQLADRFLDQPLSPPVVKEKTGQKVAVVGGGPAGLAGAFFLTVLGHQATVFETREELGGIPRSGIPAYRLPREILDKEIADILALGVEVRTGVRIGRDLEMADLLEEHQALLLATGAWQSPSLNIPGQDLDGVERGLDFLARFNTGQTPDLEGEVLVIGGGNTAIDVIRTLLRLGVGPRLLYRRTREEMPAHRTEIEEAEEEGAEFRFLLSPQAIKESPQGGLTLTCDRMEIQGTDDQGRARVAPVAGEELEIRAGRIILATGEVPDLSFIDSGLETKGGCLAADDWGRTGEERVLAAGDVSGRPWTVTRAIGSAKRAAIALDHLLRGDDPGELIAKGRMARTMRAHLGLAREVGTGEEGVGLVELNLAYGSSSAPARIRRLPPKEREGNFQEVDQGLAESDLQEEAGRCLSCGVCRSCGNCYLFCPDGAAAPDPETGEYRIDYDFCKGCGICAVECPVAAITMEAEEGGGLG